MEARNAQKQEELITYLEKHAHEIIEYERRQQVEKTIGSGRSALGSKSLAILKVVELNKQWESFWFPTPTKTANVS